MRVRKRKGVPSDDELRPFMQPPQENAAKEQGFFEDEKEYLVLSLDCRCNNGYGVGAWVEVVTEGGLPLMFPMCYFDITDPRPSRTWTISKYENGDIMFQPMLYNEEPYFHSLLADNHPQAVEQFRCLYDTLDKEYTD